MSERRSGSSRRRQSQHLGSKRFGGLGGLRESTIVESLRKRNLPGGVELLNDGMAQRFTPQSRGIRKRIRIGKEVGMGCDQLLHIETSEAGIHRSGDIHGAGRGKYRVEQSAPAWNIAASVPGGNDNASLESLRCEFGKSRIHASDQLFRLGRLSECIAYRSRVHPNRGKLVGERNLQNRNPNARE